MQSRRNVLSTGVIAGVGIALGGGSAETAGPRTATAITQVFGDGQKLVAVAVEYDRAIRSAGLSPGTFRVDGHTVTAVYPSASADPAGRSESGRYVIVALSPDDPAAALREGVAPGGGPPGGGPREGGPPGGGPPGGPMGPPPHMPPPVYRIAKAEVVQTASVSAADGARFPPSRHAIAATRVVNLVVDDFRQLEYHDPKTGDMLRYNLFVPKGYDGSQAYPLVLFMHDLGATGPVTTTTLKQGLGAIAFASPEDQAKHPCFVLAPQYADQIVDDNSKATSMLATTLDLIEQLSREYRIDRNRLYATGQSGGAMMTIAMNIARPDLFAASFIVAGQWDPALVAPLAKDKLWILVSQGDLKAYPGENAITAELEKHGAKVSRAVWSGRSTPAQFADAVARLEAEGSPINYVALEKGTVVPPGQADNGGGNHVNTWRIAYTIPGIRDWLFRQHR